MTAEEKAKALANPGSVFKRPGDVASCPDLTLEEKTQVLKQWELDARLLQVATEEGMPAQGERPQFSEVKAAQERLDIEHLREEGAPSKIGP